MTFPYGYNIVILPRDIKEGFRNLGPEALREIARSKGIIGPFSIRNPLAVEGCLAVEANISAADSKVELTPGFRRENRRYAEVEIDLTETDNLAYLINDRGNRIHAHVR